MRRFVTGWVALTLTLAMSVLSTTTATADWEFNHDIFKDDFNDTLFGNWTSSDTTEKLIDAGDRFLGPTDRTAITLMDFANDLSGEVRLVDISFDSINTASRGRVDRLFSNKRKNEQLKESWTRKARKRVEVEPVQQGS